MWLLLNILCVHFGARCCHLLGLCHHHTQWPPENPIARSYSNLASLHGRRWGIEVIHSLLPLLSHSIPSICFNLFLRWQHQHKECAFSKFLIITNWVSSQWKPFLHTCFCTDNGISGRGGPIFRGHPNFLVTIYKCGAIIVSLCKQGKNQLQELQEVN